MAVQKTIQVVENPGTVMKPVVQDRTTTSMTAQMNAGEPVKVRTKDGSALDVIPVATGDAEIGTDELIGVTNRDSTETSSADGEVEVTRIIPMSTVLRGKATTSGNIDTQSEIDALLLAWVCFDVTALTGTNGDFTIDENEGSDSNVHSLQILRGDPVLGTLDVFVHPMVAAPYVA